MKQDGPQPRLLLVEDDATSRAFLAAAAGTLPARVESAGSLAQARQLAARHDYALLLIDVNLPDGSGPALLTELRRHDAGIPALAHTATADPDEHARLRAAGFNAVVTKPVTAQAWRAAIGAALGLPAQAATDLAPVPPNETPAPIWDDQAAHRALNGNPQHVAALRGLFLEELPGARDQVLSAAAAQDTPGILAVLHTLRASCGFVGANRLEAATRALQAAPGAGPQLAAFTSAVAATLRRMHPGA